MRPRAGSPISYTCETAAFRKAGYQPVQRGIVAVAPAVDALLSGHLLATFQDLLTEVGRA